MTMTKRYEISVCPLDCPDQCSLHVTIENERIVSVTGDPQHPVTKGVICQKVRHFPKRVYHKERVLYPMKRIGKKGEGIFERISWDEAYAMIAEKFREAIDLYGSESILPYSFYGNMGAINAAGMDRRFFHRLGASRLDRTICNAAGAAGYTTTMGANAGIDPEETIHSKLIIIWGCNLVSTNLHQTLLAEEARKRGAQVVVIDVHRNRTAKWADWFIPILPGTDAALALGIMHILIKEGFTDAAYIQEQTEGYDFLLEEVKHYDPETVSEITGVPVTDIVKLARMYGKISPSFIRIGNGIQHHDNGGMIVRTIACLPSLTGQWKYRGGGAIKGNGWYGRLNQEVLERPDLQPYPTRKMNMNQLGEILLQKEAPIKVLFVYNSNPAQVAPEQNKVRSGLKRDDLFTIVHDLFITDTAKYADLVLPATSHFENLDLYKSYWHLYLQLQQPIIQPVGEAKSNFTLFKELAKVMGFQEECFLDTEEDMIRAALNFPGNPNLSGITLERLKNENWVKISPQGPPVGRTRLYAKELLEIGLPAVPSHIPLKEDKQYPLWFISAPNHQFLNSSFANVTRLKHMEGKPVLYINQRDAATRGIQDGDRVRMRNDRGEIHLKASVGDTVLPGVTVSQGLWWEDPVHGFTSMNMLTPDRLADMAGGATFFSTRIEIERVEEEDSCRQLSN